MSLRLYCPAILILSIALSGCTQATNEATGISTESATPVVFNVSGAPTVEFSVPDMMCEASCAVKVREILSQQAGVKDVKVDFEHKLAVVAVDQDTFDADEAIAQLVDHQFTNSSVMASPEASETPQVQ